MKSNLIRKQIHVFTIGVMLTSVASFAYGDDAALAKQNLGNSKTTLCPTGVSRKVEPLFDHPLRDSGITRGPDGVYYLTGTSATTLPDGVLDFENNDGIWLWKSTDLKSWDSLGQVWSIASDTRKYPNPDFGSKSVWQMATHASRDPHVRHPVRGMTAPEIHHVKGGFYVTYSMNGYGCGLLRSKTGKAEGPYEDLGRIVLYGSDPSLFEDGDNGVYYVWGEGWVARMKDDMSGLAEKPRLLEVEPSSAADGSSPRQIGAGGAFLFKADAPGLKQGSYHLVGYDIVSRMGFTRCIDTFIATSDNVYGPYVRRDVLVSHGGQATVFSGPGGQTFATFNGADEWAAVRDKPAIVPLVPHATVVGEPYWQGGAFMKPFYPVTVGGAWANLDPLIKEALVDLTILNAPDGYYYLTGSLNFTGKPREEVGIKLWRSRDLKDWEDMGLVWKCDDEPLSKAGLDRMIASANGKISAYIVFDTEIHFIKGTYWLLSSMCCKSASWWSKDGMLMLLLKSQSCKPEGPYKLHWQDTHDHSDLWTPNLFQDDDGSCYIVGGGVGNNIGRLKDDLSGLATPLWKIQPPNHTIVGEGGHLLKIGGKYVFTSAVGHGEPERGPYTGDESAARRGRLSATREMQYYTADSLKGPWSIVPRCVPMCGNAFPFQDKQGKWWVPTHNSPMRHGYPFIYPVDIREENGDVFLEPIK